ncbi:hypothetical protein CC80DRAFT_247406 [Byssothecium circinans]|uniref:Uncharacterized protein n=1 Tax=Byssothecium circinans TaxID=147558 RepID=A0A6A5TCK5_9PLEO|nr:hypothetical protein CC80DRAFT_247406 [Byssothecium circinans]
MERTGIDCRTSFPYVSSTPSPPPSAGSWKCSLASRRKSVVVNCAVRLATIVAQTPTLCPSHQRELSCGNKLHTTRRCPFCAGWEPCLAPRMASAAALLLRWPLTLRVEGLGERHRACGGTASPHLLGSRSAHRCFDHWNPLPIRVCVMAVPLAATTYAGNGWHTWARRCLRLLMSKPSCETGSHSQQRHDRNPDPGPPSTVPLHPPLVAIDSQFQVRSGGSVENQGEH